MSVKTGLHILQTKNFDVLAGKRIGLLCNQASINSEFQHIIDLLLPLHRKNKLTIQALFGPQHGLWGHTQDNMIEWEEYVDEHTGLTVYSLYGEHRKPTRQMLEKIDLFVIDLQDVGSRYYTFIWTMALCMEACSEQGIGVLILDRPNPIAGNRVEGTVLKPDFSSFVGMYPLPQRHGMTIGEIANYLKNECLSSLKLQIVKMEGWRREMYFDESGLSWVMPSPNMPSLETAIVYPGMCLLEATNLSEGRGTTRPFEIFGAPWINGWLFCKILNNIKLPGVYFRPIQFSPAFQKYAAEICEGAFIHVTEKNKFLPVLTALALLREVYGEYSEKFEWKNPPYEYEFKKMPFDILAGNDWLRPMLEAYSPLDEIENRIKAEILRFSEIRNKYLIY